MLIYLQMLESPEEKSILEQIYLEYRGLMYHVAYEILHNEQDAEDAVHHAFVKIAENIKKITDPVCPKTHSYVVTIVEHQAIDQYPQILLCPQRCRCGLFCALCATPLPRPPISEICSQPNFRIRRNHIWALITRQKRRNLKRCGQDSGVSIERQGCPIPPSRRCMTSIGRFSNRRGSIAFIRRTWASASLTSLPPSRRTSPH